MAIKVALLGLGTVGRGVYDTITTHGEELRKVVGEEVEVAAILVKDASKPRSIDSGVRITTDFQEILAIPGLDVAVEAIVGREPAGSYSTALLEKGIHVISANKECVAYKGRELGEIAEQNGVTFSFEATVGGGIPIIRSIRELLQINRIEKIQGILNGTCNYILSDMRENRVPFEHSLSAAQQYGYAEADPTNDVEGWDAFYKVMVLSELAFGEQPSWETTERTGITGVSEVEIRRAGIEGKRIKLVASLEKTSTGVTASVKPVSVGVDHPLYAVEGVNNAVHIQTDLVGNLVLQGPGAGAKPTASAIIEDLAHVFRKAARRGRSLQSVR